MGFRCARRAVEVVCGRSVMNMWPGEWKMASGGPPFCTTTCGVTPHAQNTGTSPVPMETGSPKSGPSRFAMPSAGISDMDRCSVHGGEARVISVARAMSSGANGRMETTIGPPERSCVDALRLVTYIGTLCLAPDAPRQSSGGQRPLEAERTTQQERHQIGAPVRPMSVGSRCARRRGTPGSAECRRADRRRQPSGRDGDPAWVTSRSGHGRGFARRTAGSPAHLRCGSMTRLACA